MPLERIPIHRPLLPRSDEFAKYLMRIEQSRVYSNFGPLVKELEIRVAAHLGIDSRSVVSVSNATLALEGAVETSPTQRDTSWEVPSWTFTASVSALLRSNRNIAFRDVNSEWIVDPSTAAIAVMHVLPFGDSFHMPIGASQLDCLVIDAAASFDAIKDIALPESIPTAGVISLHATKSLNAGEGGLFFTNDYEWASRFRAWTSFGFNDKRESVSLGSNTKMSELTAAVALAALDNWSRTRSMWQAQIIKAKELTSRIGMRTSPAMARLHVAPYWIVEAHSSLEILTLEALLTSEAIETRRWWSYGCHRMGAFSDIKRDSLGKTEELAVTTLGLPFSVDQDDDAWTRIENVLARFSTSSESN